VRSPSEIAQGQGGGEGRGEGRETNRAPTPNRRLDRSAGRRDVRGQSAVVSGNEFGRGVLYIIGANEAGRRLMNSESTAKLVMIIPTDDGRTEASLFRRCLPLLDFRFHFSQFDSHSGTGRARNSFPSCSRLNIPQDIPRARPTCRRFFLQRRLRAPRRASRRE